METLLEKLILNYQYIKQASAEITLPSPYPDDQITQLWTLGVTEQQNSKIHFIVTKIFKSLNHKYISTDFSQLTECTGPLKSNKIR